MKEVTGTVGIDRNLRNLAVGNQVKVTFCDMSKAVKIAEDTRSIVRSFKRNDVRVRQRIASKYGRRRSNRVKQIIHRITKMANTIASCGARTARSGWTGTWRLS